VHPRLARRADDNHGLAQAACDDEPVVRQVFVARGDGVANQDAFERKLFVIRKRVEHEVRALKLADGRSSTSPRSRREPSATRACCSPTKSASTIRSCAMRAWCRPWAGAPALLDQHVPDLGSGSPVQDDCPQW